MRGFNRTLQVGIVKTPKTATPEAVDQETTPVDYVQIVRETTETVTKYAAIGVAGYVVLDTIRQVLVKLTPEH